MTPTGSVSATSAAQGDDVWIPSVCGMCYNQCGIRAHRQNGTLVKIEGNPDSPYGQGRLCARGLAGIQVLYDPHRLNYPLRRTNPKKGIGEDPGWERIGWDEAMDIVVDKLARVRADDPSKLYFTGTVLSLAPMTLAAATFVPAFGTPNVLISDGHQCGNAEHILARTLHASITTNPDVDYTNYLLLFGCQPGLGTYYAMTTMAQKMADARVRGMKLVVVDPYLSTAAEKADEWVPIKPGSDGALACAMLNLLLNEYRIFDAPYLEHHTDSPYLVGPDGYYHRDATTGKPMVWDTTSAVARTFDDPGCGQPAIEGDFDLDGTLCKPVFQMLKERVAKWTPEVAAEITTIPAETIERLAREFGEAAQIGSTITIDGNELPFRPAAAVYFKGAHGHDNAWPTSLAIELLCEVVGASNVPGGLLGTNPVAFGHPDTGLPRWKPEPSIDGLMDAGGLGHNDPDGPSSNWPPEPRSADLASMSDLVGWPITTCTAPAALNDADNFPSITRPEVLLNYGSNLLMSAARPEVCFDAFQDAFVININLYSDETAEALADIVLPDTCYLERLDPAPNFLRHHHPVGLGDWGHQVRQPIVEPLYERRHFSEVMLEIIERLGITETANLMTNMYFGLTQPQALEVDKHYTLEEIGDRVYRNWFGSDHGLDWFREHGVLTWPKQIREVYWKPDCKGRAQLYNEWVVKFGEKIEQIAKLRSMPGMD
ncbi:MAG: molybdopterin-dependent oxidoreductase, partial [Pseudomonadales bacterium]